MSMKHAALAIGLALSALLLVIVVALAAQRARLRAVPQLAPLSAAFKDQPLDVVYTYVDGADPVWQAARRAAKVDTVPAGNGPNRSHDSDELRFSVKATRRHMGRLLGRIYIVTMGQVPGWLDPAVDTDVTVVDHAQIFPPGLRTFNSNVIEQYLHNIPGLSEWFLYMNDDFFMHRPVTKETFFCRDHVPRFFSDGFGLSAFTAAALTLGLEPTAVSRQHTDELLRRRYRKCREAGPHGLIAHAPLVVSRSAMRRLALETADLIRANDTHVFRQPDDLVFLMFYYVHYMIDHGHGLMCNRFASRYVHITDSDWLNRLQFGMVRRAKDIQFLCLNDSRSRNFEQTSRSIRAFLADMYE